MSALLDRLKKVGHKDVVKMSDAFDDSVFVNKLKEYSTDILGLNIALSADIDGGLTSGLLVIAGPSKHFKSLYSLIMVKTFLDANKDAICLFYDSEHGSSKAYFQSVGVDTSRVMHIPISDIEQLKSDLAIKLSARDEGAIKRGEKVIIFVDSIGNLASAKETLDAENEKTVADMTRAKALKSLFRIVTPRLRMLDVPMVAVNHTYNSMELYAKTIVSGGCVDGDTEILLADDTPIAIRNVKPGNFVKTNAGPREVLASWNPDTLEDGNPECIRVVFEDGTSVVCSEDHPFFIDEEQRTAWELNPGDDLDIVV